MPPFTPRPRVPGYCRHKATGQAFVRLDGRMHYLGAYDSPESKARYRDLIREWRLRTDPAPTRPSTRASGE